MSDILDRMLADDGDPWTARQVAKINRLGCPLEDCPGSVPWVGDVEAALHVHFAECHRQLIDRKHDGPWALFIAEHVQAAAKVCAA